MELYSSSNMLILYMWRPGEWVPSTQDVLRLCGSKPADRGPTCASCHPMWSHPQSYQTNSKNIAAFYWPILGNLKNWWWGSKPNTVSKWSDRQSLENSKLPSKRTHQRGFCHKKSTPTVVFLGWDDWMKQEPCFFLLKWSSSGRKNNGH